MVFYKEKVWCFVSRKYDVLLLEALQLQRSFGLLNEFFPFGSVSDAVLPVSSILVRATCRGLHPLINPSFFR
jgi:hypothetical protein